MIYARLIVGIVALVCASICGMASTLVSLQLVDKVNEQLPEDQRFATLGWHLSRYQRLSKEYRRLYPDGNLLRKTRIFQVLAVTCLLISLWALRLFPS